MIVQFGFCASTLHARNLLDGSLESTVLQLGSSGGACAPTPSGLVSWWRAENDLGDTVGGNDGTPGGNVTFAPGKVGQSFSLDGDGDGIRVGNPASLRLQEFTIESWVKRGSVARVSASSIFGEIVGYGWGGYVFGFWSDGKLFLSKHGIDHVTSIRAVTDTNWHHLAVTKAGNKVVFYIDGVAELEALYNTTFEFTTDLTIGAVNDGFEASFLGLIDEVSIYNRALAAVEVQSIFNAGAVGKCAPLPSGRAIAHWKFDETSGNIAHDSAGSFDGTLSPGGSSFVPSGISGSAISLSKAANGFVDMGRVLEMERGDFSVVAWVKMNVGDRTECSTIVGKQRAGYANGYVIAANRCGGPTVGYGQPGKAWFYDSDYQGQEVTSTTSVNDGNWHQIVGVYAAGRTKSIHVDGAPAEASNSSRTIVANPGRFLIGGVDFDGTPASTFTGLIDDVQLYNFALTPGDVDFLFSHPGQEVAPREIPVRTAIAHWKFDETSGNVAQDSAGSYNGTLSPNGASFVAAGVSGGALSVNVVSNGFVSMGNVLGLNTGDFSIIAWVKTVPANTNDRMFVLSKHAGGFLNGYILALNPSAGYGRPGKAWFYDSAFGGQEVISTSTVAGGRWHQIGVVYEAGGNKSIYVDGAPSEASNKSRPIVPNTAPFLIGGVFENGSSAGSFTGLIDDVQVYNFALSPENVNYLFENPGQEVPPQDIPVGQWRLTTTTTSGGTVTRDPDLPKYTNGATVTLRAVANAGFLFAGWSGDGSGTNNPITITMNGDKTVTASFREIPARVLAVANPEARREGNNITFPIELTSQGEIGGMSFILRYDPTYLREPELDWSSVLGFALSQVNVESPGVIRATFALPATAVPPGTKTVAIVSFRARSVPFTLNTDLILQILDVSRPTGDPITSGSFAQNGQAHILKRRVIGDCNGNDRLDIGDATIIQQLLTGFREVRAWDVTSNDLNGNGRLDSGDVVKVLRVVTDLDPQPAAQSGPGTGAVSPPGLHKAGPGPESVELVLDKSRARPGDLITVQVRLQGVFTSVAGGSFKLDYPVSALRLLNSQSQRTGALVPARAVAVWNVAPAQNNYSLQTGRVSAGISSPTAWPTNNGVLAEFTFQVQAGQTAQHCWPVRVSEMEITENGYELRAVPDAQTCFVGRDPIPPRLDPAGIFLTSQGASFSLNLEIGIPCTIEVSSDLRNWLPLTTLNPTSGTLTVVDPHARNSVQRFYRAKQ